MNISLRLCFAQGLAKCRGGRTGEGVWRRARCCVRIICRWARLIGPQARDSREQASSSSWGSRTVKVQACLCLSPKQTQTQKVHLSFSLTSRDLPSAAKSRRQLYRVPVDKTVLPKSSFGKKRMGKGRSESFVLSATTLGTSAWSLAVDSHGQGTGSGQLWSRPTGHCFPSHLTLPAPNVVNPQRIFLKRGSSARVGLKLQIYLVSRRNTHSCCF